MWNVHLSKDGIPVSAKHSNSYPSTQRNFNNFDLYDCILFLYIRLKKEHELVRQETVQVILGEQKLQVEHRLLKNELDELTKVRCQGHMNALIHVSLGILRRLEIKYLQNN